MSDKDAWQRVLVFAKQVFADIATVRAPNSESSMGSMIWSSFRTAELLKEYQRHNWVEHPKTSSILALTSMRKEGKAMEELSSKVNSQVTTVNRHTTEIKRLTEDIKELRKKNPSLK
jgi:wobble nucleotide-excising tRNase